MSEYIDVEKLKRHIKESLESCSSIRQFNNIIDEVKAEDVIPVDTVVENLFDDKRIEFEFDCDGCEYIDICCPYHLDSCPADCERTQFCKNTVKQMVMSWKTT